MLGFKFEQNCTISEEFDFLRGWGKGSSLLIYKFYSIGNHMKMFCFKFQQNRTINEEFDFLRSEGGEEGDSHS